jgi:hypothetical protein
VEEALAMVLLVLLVQVVAAALQIHLQGVRGTKERLGMVAQESSFSK